MSCRGSFEIRDDHGDKALVVELRKMVSEKPIDPLFIAAGVTFGINAIIFCCCCCLKFCKSAGSSDRNVSEAAVTHQEYDYEPAGAGQPSQPLMPSYPVPAYSNHSDALVHNPPTVDAASAEVPAPADDATVLNLSDNEPQFELKGMHFPLSLPLSSDSVYQDVYTSDKLSFK